MIQDRDSGRTFFLEVWGKHKRQMRLEALEQIVLNVILQHPEYHVILEKDEKEISAMEFTPEMGMTNPFLHMGMHIAIKEQLSIDQPVGIRDRFDRLLKRTGNEHDTMHQIMECLAEMIWQAQRSQSAPDASIYFECLDKREN